MEVTLTAVKRTPRIAKSTGKPFVSLGIKTNQHGERWLSGFGNTDNADWQSGDTVHIDVEQKGEYLNFTAAKEGRQAPAPTTMNADIVVGILNLKVLPTLAQIQRELITISEKIGMDYQEPEDDMDKPPF